MVCYFEGSVMSFVDWYFYPRERLPSTRQLNRVGRGETTDIHIYIFHLPSLSLLLTLLPHVNFSCAW